MHCLETIRSAVAIRGEGSDVKLVEPQGSGDEDAEAAALTKLHFFV